MIDMTDSDVIAQLRGWAGHLASGVPESTAEAVFISAASQRPRRGAFWLTAIAATAAAAALVFFRASSDHRIEPSPPVVSTTSVADTTNPTTSTASIDGLLPLVGTQWSAVHDQSRMILELQQVHDGQGIVVGLLGRDPGVEGGCSAIDGTVSIDGTAIRFSDLSADLSCDNAGYFLAALRNVATHFEQAGGELVMRDNGGTPLLTFTGCTSRSCSVPPLSKDNERRAPLAPLIGQWRLDFTDSGVTSAVFLQYSDIKARLSLDGQRAEVTAGVAGGCFEASAPYTTDGQAITFGTFTITDRQCDLQMSRVVDRLQGRQKFTIEGRVLNVAGLDFIYERPPVDASASTIAP